ncbi:MAG: leucine-rich repeat protein [Oscillospiraceae bacterium]|nr:leucine-rich repeat protein [Oscillospiraceae bacterium]
MKRLIKRLLSLVLAGATALCAVPMNDGIAELFSVPVTANAATAKTPASGNYKYGSWTFDSSTGKLTVKGDYTGYLLTSWSDEDVTTPTYPVKNEIKQVVISSGVEQIQSNTGLGSFESCKNLTSVTVPSSVRELCTQCFCRCENLTSIDLSGCSRLTTLPSCCFYICSKLKTVKLPVNLSKIGSNCFYSCTVLTGITLPESVEAIEQEAFRGSGLTTLTTNRYLTNIGKYAFKNCNSLTEVTLVNGLKTLGDEAFRECALLETVSVPASVTSFGAYAFYECPKLQNVTLEDGLNAIGQYAFSGCETLASITIPGSVQEVSARAFRYCQNLNTVILNEGTKTISDAAFYNCDNLTEITIPASVTSVGQQALGDCLRLESVTFLGTETAIYDEKKTIYNQNTTYFYYDGKIIGYEDSLAESYAAKYDRTFETLPIIPPTPTSGHCGSFANWAYDAALQELTISGTGWIDSYMSAGDTPWAPYAEAGKIRSVVIEEGITVIGDRAFQNAHIRYIELPSTLTTIYEYALAGNDFRSLYIPDSVTYMDSNIASDCKNLTNLHISENLEYIQYGSFMGCTALKQVTLPKCVCMIGRSVFEGCSALTDVYVLNPDCVTEGSETSLGGMEGKSVTLHANYISATKTFYKSHIYYFSFRQLDTEYCGEFIRWSYDDRSWSKTLTLKGFGELFTFENYWNTPWYSIASEVKNLVLPEGITHITSYAFYNFSNLKSVTVPASVQQIDDYAFAKCAALESVTFLGAETQIYDAETAICNSISNSSTHIFFTGTIFGQYNSGAHDYATSFNYKFQSMDGAFCGDNMVYTYDEDSKTLTITGSGEMTDFANSAHAPWNDFKSEIENIILTEGITSVGNTAFESMRNLKSITLPSTLKRIGNNSFNNVGLTEIILPDGLETIGTYAFMYTDSLTKLVIPGTVTSFGTQPMSAAFSSAEDAANVLIIGEGITEIDGLGGSSKVKTVYLPESCASIGENTFPYCYRLTDIYIPNKNCDIFDSAKTLGCNDNLTVHGYAGSTAQAYAENYGFNFEALIIPAPVITKQPAGITANAGETVAFTVAASGSDLRYQWQFNNGSGWKNSSAAGAQTTEMRIEATAARDGQKYRCVIHDGNSEPAISTAVTLKVKPTITTQPRSVTAVIGTTAKFTVATDAKTPSYQWQYNNGSGWKNSSASGAKTATLSIEATAARNGQKYRCIVKAASGASTTSSAVILTTKAAAAVITAQPKNVSAAVGATAQFTVTATGNDLKYQWQYDNGSGWKNSSQNGAKTATLSVPVIAARDGQKYRCLVTAGTADAVPTNAAVLKVKATVTAQPKNVTAAAGETAQFTVTATGVTLSYQWQVNTGSGWKNSTLESAATATLKVQAAAYRSGYQYRCIVSSVNGTTDTSAAATLTVS